MTRGETLGYLRDLSRPSPRAARRHHFGRNGWQIYALSEGRRAKAVAPSLRAETATLVPVNANERIAAMTTG
jgi:hypothetical protein